MGGWLNGVWSWGNLGINPLSLVDNSIALELEALGSLLEGYGPCSREADVLEWKADSDGVFSVASCYNFFAGFRIPYGPSNIFDGALSLIWKVEVSFKVKAFGWRLLVNRLSTKDLLLLRGILFSEEASKCVFCGIDPKSMAHSFFVCPMVKLVWDSVACWFGKPCGGTVENVLGCFSDWFFFCTKKKVKEGKIGVVWFATVWTLWLYRNGVCFRNEVWNVDNTIWSIKVLVWKWAFIGDITHPICDFYEFNKNPLFYIS
ncbi:uncharacterized protein LOC131648460 [Vicia villosa]|uniref:uncharacterized protein LOC131648460 n=1 Tax=Vicia villosa TaxID=3911 RepID=UPI00273A8C3E|nr:uncharacterized protein LOC131648460 [Vicia villosa]